MFQLKVILILWIVASVPASAGQRPHGDGMAARTAQLAALRAGDLRVAALIFRLAIGNADKCEPGGAATGLQLHAPGQYTADFQVLLEHRPGRDGDVAVNGVVPGSPADEAGVSAESQLLRIGNAAVADMATTPDSRLAAARASLSRYNAIGVEIVVAAAGMTRTIHIDMLPACAVDVDVISSPVINAQSAGREIRVNAGLVNLVREDGQLSALLAHELAHLILEHRSRLDAAGIHRGIAGQFGRSRRLLLGCEIEADRFSLALLRDAGLAPTAAVDLWTEHGAAISGGPFRAGTHPPWRDRARVLAAAIDRSDEDAWARPYTGCPAEPMSWGRADGLRPVSAGTNVEIPRSPPL